MRTTLTLDSEVARRLKDLAHRRKVSFKQIVNEMLNAGLNGSHESLRPRRFRVKASRCGLRPGVDMGRLNQLVDELEANDFEREHGKTR